MKKIEPSRAATLAALGRRSAGRALLAIAGRVLAILAAATAAEAAHTPWAIVLSTLIIGTAQYGLGEVLVHEASHGNLARARWMNDALGLLMSWPFFYTFEGYRRFHLQHHRLALDDPDNSIFEEYRDWRLPLSDERVPAGRMFWLLALRPLTGIIALYHLWGVASDAYYDSDLRENSLMWLAWGLVVAASVWLGSTKLLLLYWLMPLFLVFSTLNYWSEISDHYRTSGMMTRSYLGRWWNLLAAGNIGYHAIHHKYPGIPWFALATAREQIGADIPGQTSRTLAEAFRQICSGRQVMSPSRHPAGVG